MSGAFILQRQVSKGFFDAETFDTRDAALAALRHAKWAEDSRIRGNGGTSYTMEHPQGMRVIEVIA